MLMVESFFSHHFTGEVVLGFWDEDGVDGGLDDTFFPGINDILWFTEEEGEDEGAPT